MDRTVEDVLAWAAPHVPRDPATIDRYAAAIVQRRNVQPSAEEFEIVAASMRIWKACHYVGSEDWWTAWVVDIGGEAADFHTWAVMHADRILYGSAWRGEKRNMFLSKRRETMTPLYPKTEGTDSR